MVYWFGLVVINAIVFSLEKKNKMNLDDGLFYYRIYSKKNNRKIIHRLKILLLLIPFTYYEIRKWIISSYYKIFMRWIYRRKQ